MASNTGQAGFLPSGAALFCTIPDIFYLVELVFGGLVLCLVASTKLEPNNPQAYVIFVTIFCFIMTFIWLIVFATGSHRSRSSWASADVAYHGFASLLYLSASVLLALITIQYGTLNNILNDSTNIFFNEIFNLLSLNNLDFSRSQLNYKLDIAAVVFSFFTTLLYVIHTIFSALRWKSF
ncbi:myelin and lymphocyte protein-like [Siphateles boraxobius]|uniref:myelin and lymphocyte protein-like n=1 Tax=Siphateles boraxobius TaxID=180520 RepID=UPI0040629635